MARLALAVLVAVAFALPKGAKADEIKISQGVISQKDVEVTTDTGEVLDQRLNVGDKVFIIRGGKEKKGWERISKSPDDTVGIGWVESIKIMGIQRWDPPSSPSKKK